MSLSLEANLTSLGQVVRGAAGLLLFLDCDGTLAPITDHPEETRLASRTKRVLRTLARLPGVTIAVISGRRLEDVRTLVDVEGLFYAGNHGLEIAGPESSLTLGEAMAQSAELLKRARTIEALVARLPGVWVECKGLTASIHYRQVLDADTALLAQLECIVKEVCYPDFRIVQGHKVHEVRPLVDWNKGSAARWIASRIGSSGHLAIAAGDDTTDEDMFKALPDALTIRIGRASGTAARYHSLEQMQFIRFLELVADQRAVDI